MSLIHWRGLIKAACLLPGCFRLSVPNPVQLNFLCVCHYLATTGKKPLFLQFQFIISIMFTKIAKIWSIWYIYLTWYNLYQCYLQMMAIPYLVPLTNIAMTGSEKQNSIFMFTCSKSFLLFVGSRFNLLCNGHNYREIHHNQTNYQSKQKLIFTSW